MRKPTWLPLVFAISGGCSATIDQGSSGSDQQDITDVQNSAVKRQSIGNCWIYATASWAESLHLAATGNQIDTSESYWTYWHWFDQISIGRTDTSNEISTGGWFRDAADIIRRYGVMTEAAFIPSESAAEMSERQRNALAAINLSLKSGALKDLATRSDRTAVRRELDRVWQLSDEVVAQLDQAFGADAARTFSLGTALNEGTEIVGAGALAAAYTRSPGAQPQTGTLSDALNDWRTSYYPFDAASRRAFQIRVQRALNDRQPVIMSWWVDFNALDAQGGFAAPPATPGHSGGHMVVMEDYQVSDVPGFGTLPAGVIEARPEALTAALAPEAKLEFVRVKNSWGSLRLDRPFALPGFNDLHMPYLDGPVKQCLEVGGVVDPTTCLEDQTWWDAVFPPGY